MTSTYQTYNKSRRNYKNISKLTGYPTTYIIVIKHSKVQTVAMVWSIVCDLTVLILTELPIQFFISSLMISVI